MQNARLDEAQAGIKIARRNISNLRKADDTTLTAEMKRILRIKGHLLYSQYFIIYKSIK